MSPCCASYVHQTDSSWKMNNSVIKRASRGNAGAHSESSTRNVKTKRVEAEGGFVREGQGVDILLGISIQTRVSGKLHCLLVGPLNQAFCFYFFAQQHEQHKFKCLPLALPGFSLGIPANPKFLACTKMFAKETLWSGVCSKVTHNICT